MAEEAQYIDQDTILNEKVLNDETIINIRNNQEIDDNIR